MDLKAVVTPHHRSTWFGSNSLAVCLAVIRKKLTQRGLALVARRAKTGLVCRSKKVSAEWSEESYLVWDQEVACSNHVAPTVCLGLNQTTKPLPQLAVQKLSFSLEGYEASPLFCLQTLRKMPPFEVTVMDRRL